MNSVNSAFESARSRALSLGLLLAAGCGTQAGDGYLGEPMLRMQGHVTVDALNAASASVPALCFRELTFDPALLRRDRLPAELQADLINSDWGGAGANAHIVDVETRGQFPAEFDVDVYVPPPPAAVKAEFTGEPRAAFGQVCAVAQDHPAVAQSLLNLTVTRPADDGSYSILEMRISRDGSHFYGEQIDCLGPNTPVADCEKKTYGDPQLMAAGGGFEFVFGIDDNVQVIYFEQPAPAGSYAAYRAGAPEGLPAGYHIRGVNLGLKPNAPEACLESWVEPAVAEVNAQFGTSYDSLPTYFDDIGEHPAPADVIAAHRRISARLEMEACPLENLAFAEVSPANLRIDLHARDSWGPAPPVPPMNTP
jgi:hypothetical protein